MEEFHFFYWLICMSVMNIAIVSPQADPAKIPWIESYERLNFFRCFQNCEKLSTLEGVQQVPMSIEKYKLTFFINISDNIYVVFAYWDTHYFSSDYAEVYMIKEKPNAKLDSEINMNQAKIFPYIGRIGNSTHENLGSLRGIFFGHNKDGSKRKDGVLNCEFTLLHETYYIEPTKKYCATPNRRFDICLDEKKNNAILYKGSDVNLTDKFECSQDKKDETKCNKRRHSDVGTSTLRNASFTVDPPYTERINMKKNVPRACNIEVTIDYTVHNLFGEDKRFVLNRVREYVNGASEIFRKQDFGGDDQPDNVRIKPTLFRYVTPDRKYPDGETKDITKILSWLTLFPRDEKNLPCAIIAFTNRNFNNFHFFHGQQGTVVKNQTRRHGGICDRPQMQKLYHEAGIVSLSKDGVPYPDRVAVLALTHLLAHMFGAYHDDAPGKEKLECNPPDAEENGYFLTHSIPVDGSKPNHDKFSPCALKQIRRMFEHGINGSCMRNEQNFTCGNAIVEPWEECDCNRTLVVCHPNVEPCCKKDTVDDNRSWLPDRNCTRNTFPEVREMRDGNIPDTENCCHLNCTLKHRPEKTISCTANIIAWKEILDPQCVTQESKCNEHYGRCEPNKDDKKGYPCKEGLICVSGKCGNDVCKLLNLEDCTCSKVGRECQICCKNQNGECMTANQTNLGLKNPYELDLKILTKPKGTLCASDSACNEEGVCMMFPTDKVTKDDKVTKVTKDDKVTKVTKDDKVTKVTKDDKVTKVTKDDKVTKVTKAVNDTKAGNNHGIERVAVSEILIWSWTVVLLISLIASPFF